MAMSVLALFLFLIAAAPAVASGSVSSVTPIQKVIQLLVNMQVKAKEEKNAEQVEYAKFNQFCTDTQASKAKEIADGKELMESLSANIAKLESEARAFTEQIAGLHETIAKSEADLKAAKEQRKKDHKGNTAQMEDLTETTDALEHAIATMQKQSYDRKGTASLLQEGKLALPNTARNALEALLEMQDDGDKDILDYRQQDSPQAHAYEFQSGGIVELMKKLLTDFTEQRTEAEKAEMNSQHASGMLSQDLTDTIENAQADSDDATAMLDEKKRLLAADNQRLASATNTYNQDVAYLEDLKVECEQKGKSFQEKQGLRTEEIQAIDKAIEILGSPDVLGAAEIHLPSAAAASAASLAQLRSAHSGNIRTALAGFLSGEGRRLGSKQLGLLAQRIASSANPFGKVKGMIKTMIEALLREAGEESEHKGFCDTELGTNKMTRTRLQASVDELTARIDEGKANVVSMSQRLEALSKSIDELTESMSEATKLRTEEKAKNEQTIKDAQDGQTAVAKAIAVLKDFYAKAGQATALVQMSKAQQPVQYDRIGNEEVKMGSEEWNSLANPNAGEIDRGHKEGMQTFGKTYQGQQSEVGSVLAILEVVTGDFGRLEADSMASETEAAKAYDDFMAESKKSVAVNSKEVEMTQSDKSDTEMQIKSDRKDLANSQDQLLAADRYYDKLKPTCVDTGVNYADRAKAREAEIQSLQEALKILRSEE
mmetsp:Transcript_148904/g.478399  ORF Transcript_148904/g.478399 Transcript_148904/m.478399 type:complete len:714 (-) Transcript_148904:58-2199(-)